MRCGEAGAWGPDDNVDFDEFDWWFRTEFDAVQYRVRTPRLAVSLTVSEVWLNGRSVLTSDNMFLEHVVEAPLCERNEIVVCCRSWGKHLSARSAPRLACWKTRLVEAQQLRWVQMIMLGRIPSRTPPAAPVGIWRAVEVLTDERRQVRVSELRTAYEDGAGSVDFAATVDGLAETRFPACLVIGEVSAELVVEDVDSGWSCSGRLRRTRCRALVPIHSG